LTTSSANNIANVIVSEKKQLQKIPQDQSALLVILFGQSNSSSYPLAVRLAKGFPGYKEANLDNKKIHTVNIQNSRKSILKGVTLLKLIGAWKSTQVIAQNGPLSRSGISTLECYLKSFAFKNRKNHCHRHHEAIGNQHTYLLPCKELHFRFDSFLYNRQYTSPTKLRDFVKSVALDTGCAWCPNFNANECKQI
jgi:hypothetical protein